MALGLKQKTTKTLSPLVLDGLLCFLFVGILFGFIEFASETSLPSAIGNWIFLIYSACILLDLSAIVFSAEGLIGISRNENSLRGRAYAISCIILAVMFFIYLIVLPSSMEQIHG